MNVGPLLHDIRRTLTSKSVIILMVLLILLSLTLVGSFVSIGGSTSGINFANTQILSYYDTSGEYHFLAFATNQFGQPVSGIILQANLTAVRSPKFFGGPVTTTATSSPVYQGPSVSTNSSGDATFTIKAPLNYNYTVVAEIIQPNGFSQTIGGFSQPYLQYVSKSLNSTSGVTEQQVPIPPGQIVSIISQSPVSPVTDTSNSQLHDIQVIWAGANGSLPKNYALYYKFINITETCTQTGSGQQCSSSYSGNPAQGLNETNMQFIANLASYSQIFAAPKLEANLSSAALIAIALFYPNGTVVSQGVQTIPIFELYPQAQPSTPISLGQANQIVISFFGAVFGIFIPLMAIIGSYNSYGKDRVSGVLESVLAQPVSRRGLSLSRFFSSFIAMAIALAISLVVVDGIVSYFAKTFVSSTIMLASAGAFLVELAAFIGIMMLLSHLVKSSGALIGIGVGLFVVIDFFWSILLVIISNLSEVSNGSVAFYQDLVVSEFVNPAQFVGLVDSYLTHQLSFAGITPFYFPITPDQYGITIPSLIVTGIVWAIIPLVGFLYLAIKRD